MTPVRQGEVDFPEMLAPTVAALKCSRCTFMFHGTPEQKERIGRIKKFATLKEFKDWVYDEKQTTKALGAPSQEEMAEAMRDYEKTRPTRTNLKQAKAALAAQDKKIDSLNAIMRCLHS